jgi:hypothetical protein
MQRFVQNNCRSTRLGTAKQFGWCMHNDELSSLRSLSLQRPGHLPTVDTYGLNARGRIATSGRPRKSALCRATFLKYWRPERRSPKAPRPARRARRHTSRAG